MGSSGTGIPWGVFLPCPLRVGGAPPLRHLHLCSSSPPWYVSAWRRLCWWGVAVVSWLWCGLLVSLCVVCLVYIKDPNTLGSWRRLSVCPDNLVFFFDSGFSRCRRLCSCSVLSVACVCASKVKHNSVLGLTSILLTRQNSFG